MDVSIIIVNYNTRDLLKNCLISIYKHTTEINFEVIVSDNGSVDGSIEMLKQEFPQVVLIENNANLGFGTANNRGLAVAKGKYIFYLNSDTILLNNAVKLFYDYWENSPEKDSIGALGCNLLDGEGKQTHSFESFPSSKKIIKDTTFDFLRIVRLTLFFFLSESFSFTKQQTLQKEKVPFYGKVDYIIGADLFLRNNVYAQFDEKYFLYYEDTDLQKKLENQGFFRQIIAGPAIQHLEHKSNKFKKKIDFYSSTGKVHRFLSSIIFLRKYEKNHLVLFYLKLIISLCWLSPCLIKSTLKFIPKLWSL